MHEVVGSGHIEASTSTGMVNPEGVWVTSRLWPGATLIEKTMSLPSA